MRLVCVAVNFGMGQWGEEVFLTLAQAAVEQEKRRMTEPDGAWTVRYAERIAAAEALLTSLSEDERSKQRRHIASLRRALTLGPHGLKVAAERANRSRSELLSQAHVDPRRRLDRREPSVGDAVQIFKSR